MATEQETATLARRLEELLSSDDVTAAAELLASVHPADQADLYQRSDPDARETLLALLTADGLAQLLGHLDEDPLAELIDRMPRASLAAVLDRAANDVAADILRQLPPAEAARVLSNMASAADVTPLLGYADESAGGLMTRGYVALHRDMTAAEAMTFLRLSKPLAEEAYYLYVLDSRNHLQGVVNLRQLIVADPTARIEDVMTRDVVTVPPGADQEEAARLLQHYRLRALPVVDADGALSGIITADDVIDVITEEATEDMYRLAGLPADESIFAPVSVSARRRIPWLVINLVTAFAAAGMVAIFEGTIAKAAALAVFMPIIAGQGGNAGIQTITIVVRGIALGEIEPRDARRVLGKEIALGIIRGILFGLIVGVIALAWKGAWGWGLVVGLAMLLNMLVAGLFGVLVPLAMKAARLDPAIASGVFLTTFTDVMGFFFLLGLGSLLIDELT
ncbi:MAG TPA: magnesium transporter [Dehalococcoidia bacterium]|nr:magnesium transporter [Dehalococcoidia bacterium]